MKTLAVLLVLALTATAHAAPVFCRKKKGGVVIVRERACRKGQVQLNLGEFGAAGTPGTPGTPGAAGADGQLRIYGNGSAGARAIATDEDWTLTPVDDPQFTDFTVNAGVTLTVPSGTVIRGTGTFTNNGKIVVARFAAG